MGLQRVGSRLNINDHPLIPLRKKRGLAGRVLGEYPIDAGASRWWPVADMPSVIIPLREGKTAYKSDGTTFDATFARAGSKRYIDDTTGIVTTAGNDILVIQDGGAVLENPSTNYCFRSEEFDNASWAKIDGTETVTANAATGPDGTSTADKISVPGITGTEGIKQTIAVGGAVTGKAYTFSIWLKAGTNVKASIRIRDAALTETAATAIDLTTVWARYQVTVTFATSVSTSVIVYVLPHQDATIDAGDAYAWGAQLEQNYKATSYIPTTSASASRVQDFLTVPTSYISDSAGTAIISFLPNMSKYSTSSWCLMLSGTGSEGTLFSAQMSAAQIRTTDLTTAITAGITWAEKWYKFAITWEAKSASRTIYNLTDGTSGSGSYDGSFNLASALYIGGSTNLSASGRIRDVMIWNKKLSAAQIGAF